jgi:DNA modification methylase
MIEYLPVGSLRPDPKNARLHSEKQVQQIAKSIEAFGFNVPVLVDANSRVLAGHGRLRACERLRIAQVPVIRLEHLSEHQRLAFMLADNRLSENSEWDNRLLGEQLKILSEAELDFSLEVTGFEIAEIDLRIQNLCPIGEQGDDSADTLPERSTVQVSRIGDIWQLGKHRILCGDALCHDSYKSLMGGRRADMAFTGPPNNVPIPGIGGGKRQNREHELAGAPGGMSEVEFTGFLSTTLACLAAHSLPGSLHFICMDWRNMKELLAAAGTAYSELKNVCVWVKDNAGKGSLYRSQHELVFIFKHGKGSRSNKVRPGRARTNVWHYAGADAVSMSSREGDTLAFHQPVKPVAMVADAILDFSVRGDLVVDPFLGSGTTLVAAEQTGRMCYGLELDPRNVDTIVRRWQTFTGRFAYRVTDQGSFNDLEKEARRE